MAKQRILVVDDDFAIREVLRRVLQTAGYEVMVAADGAFGRHLAATAAPDLMITDNNMPSPSGLELLRELRADPATANLPVILMTAHLSSRIHFEGLELNAKAVIAKPFSNDDVLSMVHQILSAVGRPAPGSGSS